MDVYFTTLLSCEEGAAVYTVGTGQRFDVGVELFDGELCDVLGHVGELSSRSQLGALNEAAEAAADARRVQCVLLARADLGRQQRNVVAVLVPPDVASLVSAGVARHRPRPATRTPALVVR